MRLWTLCWMFLVVGCSPSNDAPAEAPETADANEFLDPVVVDGEHYVLEFENDSLRVLRENLAGGEGGAMHSHRARVSIYLEDAEVKLTPRGGETTTATLVAGTAAWGEPTTHVGRPQSDIENLSIELQELGGEVIERSDIDATLVDAEHHVIEFENDWVRVVRMTYPAGKTSSVHDHPPGFAVFLTDADMQNIPEEGEPVELKFEAGDAIWGDAGTAHATANPGDEDVVLIRVEMKKKPS